MYFEKVKSSNAIDYMLRTTRQHHVQLSVMADQKENIIIVFSSVLLAISFAKCTFDRIWWGSISFGFTLLSALVIAVLSVVTKMEMKKENLLRPAINHLQRS